MVLRSLSRLGHNFTTSLAPLVRAISGVSGEKQEEGEVPPTVAQLLGIPLESGGAKATPEFHPVLSIPLPQIEADLQWRCVDSLAT